MDTGVEIGLLIVRLVVGVLLMGHGLQKLMGWFGGGGLSATTRGFDRLGYHPPLPMAVLAGVGELASGFSIAAGFLFPLGAGALIAVMINAGAVHWPNGLWLQKNGIEACLIYATVGAGLAFTGAGSYSVDALLGLDLTGIGWSVGAVVVAVVAGGLAQLARVRTLAKTRPSGALG